MRLVFDPDFDLGAWPGPRQGAAAVAGNAWVGPAGFLSILETELGLLVPHATEADRVAALVPRLFRADRFFGASARVDPWATGLRLLRWRDLLWEHGWRGEGLGQTRLSELAEVTLGIPHGRGERLETVAGWLTSRRTDIEEVRILDDAVFSPAWQAVLSALAAGGTRVERGALPNVEARGNLEAIRHGLAVVGGDRSVQLVRPSGPREGARALAAALAVDPALEETVFISPDGVLDEALVEFGLPALGAPTSHRSSALSELLALTIGLAWSPVDPLLAHDWLSLPDSPLPKALAKALLRTLEKWPAVGNPDWMTEVDRFTKSDPLARDVVETVFVPLTDRSREVRVRDLLGRVVLVERWARERVTGSDAHAEVVEQCELLRRRFELAELARLSPPALEAVLASATGHGASRREPRAGYEWVGLPGGVAGKARRVVWWQFLGPGAPMQDGVVWRADERVALEAIGVRLPSLGDEVRRRSARARRPLLQTSELLVLVAPLHDEAGEKAHPHSLWDEIAGRLPDARDARHLLVEAPIVGAPPARQALTPLAPPPPERVRRVSLSLVSRQRESPTSLAKLIGCSFAYAVEYLGRIRANQATRPRVDNRLFGQIAHEVLAQVALAGSLVPGRARAAALDFLDRLLPTHGALLLLAGHQQELAELREAVASSAEALAQVMAADQLRVRSVETELLGSFDGGSLVGTPDLVLEDASGRLILLDLKWSGETYRRDELRSGTAVQLSAYAALLEQSGASVRTAGYVILRQQRILVRGEAISYARVVSSELLGDTWLATEAAWKRRSAELLRGEIFAEGVETADHARVDSATLIAGSLSLPAPCQFCGLDLLCGQERGRR